MNNLLKWLTGCNTLTSQLLWKIAKVSMTAVLVLARSFVVIRATKTAMLVWSRLHSVATIKRVPAIWTLEQIYYKNRYTLTVTSLLHFYLDIKSVNAKAKSTILNLTGHAFQLLKTNLKADSPTNKHQLKVFALKSCSANSIWWRPWVPDLRYSLTAKDFYFSNNLYKLQLF